MPRRKALFLPPYADARRTGSVPQEPAVRDDRPSVARRGRRICRCRGPVAHRAGPGALPEDFDAQGKATAIGRGTALEERERLAPRC